MADPGLTTGPCGLMVDLRCADQEWLDGLEPWQIERGMELARSSLSTLTGGMAANCPVTIRPCVTGGCHCAPKQEWDGPGWYPVLNDGVWSNCGCGCSACTMPPYVDLPGGVAEVIEVRVHGDVLDPSAYRVDNNRYLARLDGGTWPVGQDMTKDPEADLDTFSVQYRPGFAQTPASQWALGVLAVEFMKACKPGEKCKLPSGVTQVVRQGVTMTVSQGAWPSGMTGLPSVDSFIQEVNPHGRKSRPHVWTPGKQYPVVVTSK